MKTSKSKTIAQMNVPRNLTISYYKRLALVLGFWIPLTLLGFLLSFATSELNLREWFSWFPWVFGLSWLGYALYLFFWAFTKVNSLVVLVIDRNLGQAAIVRKIVFTQFFAIAALILGVTSFATLFLEVMGWNLSPMFGMLTIVSQVLSFKHVPLFSQLLSEDKKEVLASDPVQSKESGLSND